MRASAVVGGAALLAGFAFGVAGSLASSAGVVQATATANPIDVRLTVAPAKAPVGGKVTAKATVKNLGTKPLLGVTVKLRVDRPTVAVSGSDTITIGTLAGRHSAHATWTLCPREVGGYVAVAQATGSYADGKAFNAESGAAAFTATASKKTCR